MTRKYKTNGDPHIRTYTDCRSEDERTRHLMRFRGIPHSLEAAKNISEGFFIFKK